MRRFVTVAICGFTLCFVSTMPGQTPGPTTSVPNLVRYGGVLKDAQGAPLASSIVGVTFSIYNQQDGIVPVWTEVQNVTTDAGGSYSVLLGSSTPAGLPSDLFSQQEQRWLGVQVEGQPEQPRVLMVSVPYAFKASEADKLAGHSASEFVTTDSLQTAVKEQLQAQTTVVTSSGSQPLTSSPYIDNGTMLQTQANFNIDGTGSAAIFNATSQYNLGGAAILGTNGTQSLFLGIGAGSSNTGGPNLFLGNLAGHSNTTADYNAFIGANAGYKNTTGAQNLMLGASAGYSNTTGGYNMFIGSLSGYNNTTGSLNTFVGRATGYLNTSGSGGSFFGINAGRASTGDANTFLGEYAGTATTSGNQNTFVGGYAGQYNLTGSNNLFVGYNAGSAAATAASNNIYLASPGAGSDNGAIRIGAGQTNAYMAGIFGSTTNSGSAVFVDSTGKLGTGGGGGLVTSFDGRSGMVVPASGDYGFSLLSGTLASSQFSGGYNNAVTLSNTSNVFYGSGANLTGVPVGSGSSYYIQNGTSPQNASFYINGSGTLGGTLVANAVNVNSTYQIGFSNVVNVGSSSDEDLFLGLGAGSSNVTGRGTGNTFSGADAGFSNSTGARNTYLGSSAGVFSNGSDNTFSGFVAGYNTSTGIEDTYLGSGAGFNNTTANNNTFSGYEAGYGNSNGSTGANNAFYGAYAGMSISTGCCNAFYGYKAGYSNTSAGYNIFSGWKAGYNNTTGASDIYIGNEGPTSGTESNTIRIGTQGTGNAEQDVTYIAGIYGSTSSGGVPVYVNSNGQLGTGGGTGLVTSFNGRAGAVVPASGDYSFSLLSGTLASAQLSGTYGHAVTLSNSGNSFTGSGAGLTGVNPAPGSSNYIQNTTSPQTASFNVTGNGVLGGDLVANGGLAGSFAGTGSAVTGNATATGGTAYGVAGYTVSTSSTAAGVYGQATATTGSASGVYGQSSAPNGYGVYGTSSSVTGAGVYAINTNTSGGGYEGVALIAQADGPGAAGVLVNTNPSGILLLGASAGGTPFELDASGSIEMNGPITIDGCGDSCGNSIRGNLSVSGTLTKGGGSFKIDDPLDPANKTLSHSFVESPDMMNIYNGIVRLDARGEAWITLPQYFEALNRDFRYQLTSIGAPQPRLYIAREVKGNRFKIAGGKASAKVSWQVTGIRQDSWANAHRIPNEEDKPPQERGKYLHPELYGANADQKTDAMLRR